MELVRELLDLITIFDLIYLVITIYSLYKCSKNGFVLSILSASKWLLAYVLTLFLFPKARPYVIDVIDNEYILDIILGIGLFVIVIFIILLINRGLKKAVIYTGLGSLDKTFGFFFGFVKSYILAVCIFTTINIVYNYDRWPINIEKSISFQWVEKGSNYLIREFPDQKEHENAKQKIKDI
tara:strand:- start:4758 stop:5300 length:543 start_codon:yes stop_codon:yes gene_type:complete